jgi:alpha-amylase
MPSICFYFQVHQPFRLRNYTYFDIGHSRDYEDESSNRAILNKVAAKCYLPANQVLLKLLSEHKGAFRIAYSISGMALDQFEHYNPAVLDSFKRMADTGCVEFIDETYYHSLAFLYSPAEFRQQVQLHRERIQALFGQTPTTFRNTELIYNNDLALEIERMGYKTILAEGADRVLGWRSPNFVYQPAGCRTLRLLLKNYRLSDDIAFRFSNRAWPEYPLTADKFARWVHQMNNAGDVVNLFMDFETFGEHQWQDTGIFEFLKMIPETILAHPDFRFQTPAEAARQYTPAASLDVPQYVSWADVERDLTAWIGNDLQHDAIRGIYDLEKRVRAVRDPKLLHIWRQLQTSDHFYYMCTKWFADGDVHKYFNPYPSPYDAYITYMNVLSDFSRRLDALEAHAPPGPEAAATPAPRPSPGARPKPGAGAKPKPKAKAKAKAQFKARLKAVAPPKTRLKPKAKTTVKAKRKPRGPAPHPRKDPTKHER